MGQLCRNGKTQHQLQQLLIQKGCKIKLQVHPTGLSIWISKYMVWGLYITLCCTPWGEGFYVTPCLSPCMDPPAYTPNSDMVICQILDPHIIALVQTPASKLCLTSLLCKPISTTMYQHHKANNTVFTPFSVSENNNIAFSMLICCFFSPICYKPGRMLVQIKPQTTHC